jgi:pimeloyl-ACP methyl ester carboxylesterase
MARRLLTLVAGLAFIGACTDAPVAPTAQRLASNAILPGAQSIWAEEITGKTGPGSLYGINMPVNWNGEVIYYAHGFVDPAAPVAIPTTQDQFIVIRDLLGAQGYAVAYSSFSSNGYDFAEGLRRTHQLRGIFRSNFGVPSYSYLVGHSLGSEIGLALAETHGNQYDGALLLCGMVGGAEAHFNWVASIRILFDYFYPGVLPGTPTSMPPNIDPFAIIGLVQAAITANPAPAFYIAAIDQTPLAGTSPSEIIFSLAYALVWHARGINDVTSRAHGHVPFTNINTTYTSSVLPPSLMAAINSGVQRYAAPRDVQAWLDHNYQPTGNVGFPVLTVHTTGDFSVPIFHETLFGQLVNSAGTGDLVVQRIINRYGHCTFSTSEVITAFTDLVNWVKNDISPTP